jgi:hypothetical protein
MELEQELDWDTPYQGLVRMELGQEVAKDGVLLEWEGEGQGMNDDEEMDLDGFCRYQSEGPGMARGKNVEDYPDLPPTDDREHRTRVCG